LEEIGKDLLPAQARETYQTLAKILGNILKNPGEEKFRSLKKENKMIAEKVSRSGNAVSLLLAIGFDDDGGMYRLPADTDLEMVRMAHDLLECMILSSEEPAPAPVEEAATPAAVPVSIALPVTAATKAAAAKAAVENPQGFGRRNLVDPKRQDQDDQLKAARAARGAQFAENPVSVVGAVGGPTPEPVANGYTAGAAEAPEAPAKKTKEGVHNFANRNKAEQEKNKAASSLEDMRRAQKDKYKEWEKDPDAKKQEAYQAPPSVAGGAKADEGWFSGWFGGSSTSNGSSSKPQQPERRGPRIKGVADLPKPPRGGG